MSPLTHSLLEANHLLEAGSSRVTPQERRAISKVLHEHPELGGTPGVPSLGTAISSIAAALGKVGFSLDLVTGDTLLGGHGSRQLAFRRANPEGANAFDELPVIENSRINFTWEDMTYPKDSSNKIFEVIAYVT